MVMELPRNQGRIFNKLNDHKVIKPITIIFNYWCVYIYLNNNSQIAHRVTVVARLGRHFTNRQQVVGA